MTGRAAGSNVLPLAALAVALFGLYAFSLGRAPIYLHEAEVMFALHAHSIATTAHDTYGRFLPLYFQMAPIGENVWFQPALVYFTALFLRVLPVAEWTVRLPSVVVALADVAWIYVIARRLFERERSAVLAAALLALTPAHFIHGRIAMDYLYPVPFVLGWLWCLSVFLDRRRLIFLFAATSLLGLGMYTYIASIIMMPVYLALTFLALFRTDHHSSRPYLTALAGFGWPLVLLLWLVFHPFVINETFGRYRIGQIAAAPAPVAGLPLPALLEMVRHAVRFSELTGRLSLYWYFFDPAFLFVTGGYTNVVNSTRHVGVFLIPLLVFVPVGLVAAVRRPTVMNATTVTGFLAAPLAACLVVPEPYAIDRELAILPFGVLLAVVGVEAMLASPARRWRGAAVGLLAIIPLHFAFFLYDYYGDYRTRSAIWFNGNRRAALEEIIARTSGADPPRKIYLSTAHIPYLDVYWRLYLVKHHRDDLLQHTVYFDAESLDVRTIPQGSLMLASTNDARLRTLVQSGQLLKLADVPEPGDPPFFMLLRR